jgi:hypothetical protein
MQIKKIVIFFKSLIISTFDGSCEIFFIEFFLLQYLKLIKVCQSYIWLNDFMFYNTYFFFRIFYV